MDNGGAFLMSVFMLHMLQLPNFNSEYGPYLCLLCLAHGCDISGLQCDAVGIKLLSLAVGAVLRAAEILRCEKFVTSYYFHTLPYRWQCSRQHAQLTN